MTDTPATLAVDVEATPGALCRFCEKPFASIGMVSGGSRHDWITCAQITTATLRADLARVTAERYELSKIEKQTELERDAALGEVARLNASNDAISDAWKAAGLRAAQLEKELADARAQLSQRSGVSEVAAALDQSGIFDDPSWCASDEVHCFSSDGHLLFKIKVGAFQALTAALAVQGKGEA